MIYIKINISKKIGNATLQIQVEEPKDIDALFSAAFYASAPDKCTLCNSENVQLEGNQADAFKFIKVRCLSCNAAAQVGQYKNGGNFWKKFEIYNPNAPKK